MVALSSGRAAKWVAGAIITLLLPGMIVALLSQVSSFLGVRVPGPIPDISSLIQDLSDFSARLGFVLLVGGSLGMLLASKAEEIPVLGSVAWYLHLMGHEAVHALFAKICGYQIKRFRLARGGGYVAYYKPGARGNFLIAVSPYIFPLFPIILIVTAAAARGLAQRVIVMLLGVAVGSHLASISREAVHQYDLKQAGLFFSVSLIAFANIWLLVIVMAVVAPARISILGCAADALAFNRWYLSALAGLFLNFLR